MGGGGNGGIGGDQHMDLLRSGSAASRLKSHFYDAPPPPPHQPHQLPQSHLSAGMPHPPPPVSSPYSPHINAFLSGGGGGSGGIVSGNNNGFNTDLAAAAAAAAVKHPSMSTISS